MAPANTTANLASIGDDATNMFLSTMMSGKEAWIGGQQDDVGVWSWSDGRTFNFTAWATNQPNNGGGNQKFISTNFDADGKWNDINGNSERKSVCQYYTGTVYEIIMKLCTVHDNDDDKVHTVLYCTYCTVHTVTKQ